jgi:hypothetical protein
MVMKLHETHTPKEENTPIDTEVHLINDATEHYRNIMGVPNKKVDLKSMPKLLRWFGYFFYTAIVLLVLVFIVSYILYK